MDSFPPHRTPVPTTDVPPKRGGTQQCIPRVSLRSTILIVDDDADALSVLQVLLRMEGFEVRTALSGSAALQCVRQHRPDLIITDLKMPDMSGHELCRALRGTSETRRIPIIVHSGEAAPKTDLNYDHAFRKPAELNALLRKIHDLLGDLSY